MWSCIVVGFFALVIGAVSGAFLWEANAPTVEKDEQAIRDYLKRRGRL